MVLVWSVARIDISLLVTQPYSSLTLSYLCLLKVNHGFEYICFQTLALVSVYGVVCCPDRQQSRQQSKHIYYQKQ